MLLGYRDLDKAKANKLPQQKLTTQQEREVLYAKKEPIYQEHLRLHPKDFWKKWVIRCPAFRADRLENKDIRARQCGALAIITSREGRKKMILCPECGYQGLAFTLSINNS